MDSTKEYKRLEENEKYKQPKGTFSIKQSEILKEYRKSYLRWVILILLVFFYVTNYFCYMLPGALQQQFQSQLDLVLTEYNWIQSIYSFPNIILPMFGGIFIDKIGMRIGMILFTSLLVTGQFVQYIGFFYDSNNPDYKQNIYIFILLGRAIFGFGGESMCITINAFVSKWFQGQEQSLALSIVVSGAGLGMITSGLLASQFYNIPNPHSIQTPMYYAIFIMGIGFILVLIVCYIDQIVEKHDTQILRVKNQDPLLYESVKDMEAKKKEDEERRLLKKTQELPFWQVFISDIKSFPKLYWMLCGSMIVMYGQLIPFQNNLEGMLQTKYKVTDETVAGQLFTVPLMIQLPLCPLGGLLVDKIGKRAEVNIISSILMIIQFFLWAVTQCNITPCFNSIWIPLVIYGIANSIYNNFIWPGIALSINPKLFGTAFGILDCIQQLGIAVFPLIASSIYDATSEQNTNYNRGYFWFSVFFGSLAVVGFCMGIWIYRYDKANNNVLDQTELSKDEKFAKKQSIFTSRMKASFY